MNSEDDFCRKSSLLFQSEDDIRRKSSSLFKVKTTFCESRLHFSKLPRPNYRDLNYRFLADFYRIAETETEVLKLPRLITEPTCWLPCPPLETVVSFKESCFNLRVSNNESQTHTHTHTQTQILTFIDLRICLHTHTHTHTNRFQC